MARGGLKSSIPATSHDTLRDGRKGDPQHECCGKKGIQHHVNNCLIRFPLQTKFIGIQKQGKSTKDDSQVKKRK